MTIQKSFIAFKVNTISTKHVVVDVVKMFLIKNTRLVIALSNIYNKIATFMINNFFNSDINELVSNPCDNGGTCNDFVKLYMNVSYPSSVAYDAETNICIKCYLY